MVAYINMVFYGAAAGGNCSLCGAGTEKRKNSDGVQNGAQCTGTMVARPRYQSKTDLRHPPLFLCDLHHRSSHRNGGMNNRPVDHALPPVTVGIHQ